MSPVAMTIVNRRKENEAMMIKFSVFERVEEWGGGERESAAFHCVPLAFSPFFSHCFRHPSFADILKHGKQHWFLKKNIQIIIKTKCSGHKLSLKHLSKRTENTYCHYILPNNRNLQKIMMLRNSDHKYTSRCMQKSFKITMALQIISK